MSLNNRRASVARPVAKIFSERGWTMAALLLLLVAALCLVVFAQVEAAFVAATLGVVAWFFGLRNRLAGASIEAGDDPSQIESETKKQADE